MFKNCRKIGERGEGGGGGAEGSMRGSTVWYKHGAHPSPGGGAIEISKIIDLNFVLRRRLKCIESICYCTKAQWTHKMNPTEALNSKTRPERQKIKTTSG